MKILCLVTNGFEEVEFIGTIGILRRGGCDVDIYSFHNTTSIGKYNIEVSNLLDLKDLNYKNYDLLLIPGGPEYIEMEKTDWYLEIIHYFYKNNKSIAAICAGPTILGHLGYLKNKKYTCFTSMNEDFGGTYIDAYSVVDRNIITGRSAAATLEFAFDILEVVKGKEISEKIKKEIYF